MRILVIGGTRFVGRAFVEAAFERGHEVAVLHRGESEPSDLPAVEHLHADRLGDLSVVEGSFDAVLDTCAYVPGHARRAVEALAGRVGHYTFVSTLSVHGDSMPIGADEDTPLDEPMWTDEAITDTSYGPMKVACERIVQEAFKGRCLVIRPGYVVGPHDRTDRFTYYVRRASQGGEMAVPGPPESPFQVVDVRDLAVFMLDRTAAADAGVYGVVGPDRRITMRDVVETGRDVAGADTELVWLDEAFVKESPAGERFPMWHPEWLGAHTYDATRAVAAGLRHRPFEETVRDILEWDRARGLPKLDAGPSAEDERALLDAWRSRTGRS